MSETAEERLSRVEEQIKTLFSEVRELRGLDMALSIKELSGQVQHLVDQQKTMQLVLDDMRSKGGKRWEQVVSCIITGLVGALIAWLIQR